MRSSCTSFRISNNSILFSYSGGGIKKRKKRMRMGKLKKGLRRPSRRKRIFLADANWRVFFLGVPELLKGAVGRKCSQQISCLHPL